MTKKSERRVCTACRGTGYCDVPMYLCANPTCNEVYEWDHYKRIFCSRRCALQVAQRAMRARRKANA